MKWNFPNKKVFNQDFLNTKWTNIFTLKYDQATIWEYYEFINKSPEEQTEELQNIFKSQIKYWLKDKIMRFLFKYYVTKTEAWLNIEQITMSIFQNRYRAYKSIFTDIKAKLVSDWPKGKWCIDSVGLSSICTSYNISPTDLLKNYTLEQYFWFLDGIEWINNSGDAKWQAINDMAVIDKGAVKKRAEDTKAKFAKFKK